MVTLGIVRGVHVSAGNVSDPLHVLAFFHNWIKGTFCSFLQIHSERWPLKPRQLSPLCTQGHSPCGVWVLAHICWDPVPHSRSLEGSWLFFQLWMLETDLCRNTILSVDCWEFFFILAQGYNITSKMWIKAKGSENVFAPAASHKQQLDRTCTNWTITASRLFSNPTWSFDFKSANQFCRRANPLTDQEHMKPKWYCSP